MDSAKNDPYSQAVASGKYVRDSGLRGKYDNVRLFWEDEVTRLFLRPHLEARVDAADRGLRVLDMGCGSGDGYELLMDITRTDAGVGAHQALLIPYERLGQYRGIELNQDLLDQNAERWGADPKMSCSWGDLSQGLPVEPDEAPFDVYLASYGTPSHFTEDQTVKLFAEIAAHAEEGSLIVADWLGRHSYEWQQLWSDDLSSEQWMEYLISYIYPEEERDKVDLAVLDLRLLVREEITRVLSRVREQTGVELQVKELFDRSLLVGRHIDTTDYNEHLHPVRQAVNSLFERNLRTDLDEVILEYHPDPAFPQLNDFFQTYTASWNGLVRFAAALCQARDRGAPLDAVPVPEIDGPGSTWARAPLQLCAGRMRQLCERLNAVQVGDPRANAVEPQLAYALRELEMALQQGAGCGHGLVGVFAVVKG